MAFPTSLDAWFSPAIFDDSTRLYRFAGDGLPDLILECFIGIESICGEILWEVDVLSTEAYLPIRTWRFKQAAIGIRLADGQTTWRSGYIQKAQALDVDGGFARYRLTLVPGIWLSTQARHNRVFQNKSILEVIEQVLVPYAPYVRFRYDTGVETSLNEISKRSMIVQYQESDYALITRLLAEEGLGWLHVESSMTETPAFVQSKETNQPTADNTTPSNESPSIAAHAWLIFVNADHFEEDYSSQSSFGGAGIRWHQSDSQEEQDTFTHWQQSRKIMPNQTSTVSWDWSAKRAVRASESSANKPENVPLIKQHLNAHDARQHSQADASRYANMHQRCLDSAQWQILAAGTVRSLRLGCWFGLRNYEVFGEPLVATEHTALQQQFNVLGILHMGINNLPKQTISDLNLSCAERALSLLQRQHVNPVLPSIHLASLTHTLPLLAKTVAARGYANAACVLPRSLPVQVFQVRKPQVPAGFNLPALVVGPNGESIPGDSEVYADRYNRVRVRFFWQKGRTADDVNTAWAPVLQRVAGPKRGMHIMPRIGQEVLVGFLYGQMDQPIVITSAYNGRGEGSQFSHEDRISTPENNRSAPANASSTKTVFAAATDHRPSGQGNRAGGNSPAWHGAAAEGHNHAGALLGLRTKEWGGSGYNQLLFDDTDHQLAIQAATTQYHTQLNLGHIRHRADNYRGSFRGKGFEVRTDAYGAVRAASGLLVTTWGRSLDTPAADATAPIRLYATARDMAAQLSEKAHIHQTVRWTSVVGMTATQASSLRNDQAALAAMHHAASGMVNRRSQSAALADAANAITTPTNDRVPHSTDPLLTLAGRAGVSMTANDVLLISGESQTHLSGGNHFTGVDGVMRQHTGQAIGILGGAIKAGNGSKSEETIGLQIIAGKDNITIQAQSDSMQIASRSHLSMSANQNIDFAAAKTITLKTAGGASISIGRDITISCPGSLNLHASSHQFEDGRGMEYQMPEMPISDPFQYSEQIILINPLDGSAQNMPYKLYQENNIKQQGTTGTHGRSQRKIQPAIEHYTAIIGAKTPWLVEYQKADIPSPVVWNDDDFPIEA